MQYRATALVALLASPAMAMWDAAACSGMGACTFPSTCNYWPGAPSGNPQDAEWNCGSAGTIKGQIAAGAELNFEMGLSAEGMSIVEPADFPKNCYLQQPPVSGATLLKAVYEGITVYGWIEYSCTETTPITDGCYTGRRNGSKTTTCQVIKGGQICSHISKTVVGAC